MFLLDTNVISELRKLGSRRIDPNVAHWVAAQDADRIYLSAITLLELEIGILRKERQDTEQGATLRTWMEDYVVPEFERRTLPVDATVARRCAVLHVPNPRSERDALLAATGLVHGLTVVTRNVSDFEATGVPILNPWDAQA